MGTLSDTVANLILDAITQAATVLDYDTVYVQLHTGAPGSAGTSNVAANSTRQQATFGAASGRAATTTGAVEWTSVPNAETYTHISLWSASSNGTFIGSDDLSSSAAVQIGDTFRIPTGDLDLTVT